MLWAWLVSRLGGIGARLAVAAAVAFLVWLSLHEITSWDDRRMAAVRATAIAERDARWTAQIEKANREARERQITREQEAARESARLTAEAESLRSTIADLEARNAALPNGDRECLDDTRRRLLIR